MWKRIKNIKGTMFELHYVYNTTTWATITMEDGRHCACCPARLIIVFCYTAYLLFTHPSLSFAFSSIICHKILHCITKWIKILVAFAFSAFSHWLSLQIQLCVPKQIQQCLVLNDRLSWRQLFFWTYIQYI